MSNFGLLKKVFSNTFIKFLKSLFIFLYRKSKISLMAAVASFQL